MKEKGVIQGVKIIKVMKIIDERETPKKKIEKNKGDQSYSERMRPK